MRITINLYCNSKYLLTRLLPFGFTVYSYYSQIFIWLRSRSSHFASCFNIDTTLCTLMRVRVQYCIWQWPWYILTIILMNDLFYLSFYEHLSLVVCVFQFHTISTTTNHTTNLCTLITIHTTIHKTTHWALSNLSCSWELLTWQPLLILLRF